MNKSNIFQIMIFPIIVLSLSLSCTSSQTAEIKVASLDSIPIIVEQPSKALKSKLKFTSGIITIFEDSNGNLWFGSHREGVCFYDGETFTYFTTEDGLSDNQIWSIQEDEHGNIWFGTAKGISSYDGKKIINHTANNITKIGKISQNEWNKTDHDLWFNGENTTGVYRYDGQKLTYLPFPEAKLDNADNTHNTGFNTYHVTGFSKGKNNQIWIATYSAVLGYNGENFSIINDKNLGFNLGTGYLHIRSILEDSKGNLWIGNNGIGVLLHNEGSTINFSAKQGLIHFSSSKSGAPSVHGTLEHVFAIAEDEKGNIWFGDRDTGAWKFDGKTMTNYTVDSKLKKQMIWDIYQTKHGDLLFAMESGGVYKFNGKTFDRKFEL